MAVVFIEGFDLYNGVGANQGLAGRWVNNTGTLFMVAGRFGGQALQGSDGLAYATATLPGNYGSISCGFAFKATAIAGNLGWFASFLDSALAYQIGLYAVVGGSNAIAVYRPSSNSAGTLLGTTANNVIIPNAWHYIEIEITVSDTVGVVNLYVDSTLVLALSGVDTRGGLSTINKLRMGGTMNTSSHAYNMDDVYVTDTLAKLGERMVEALRPNADTSDADWTPLSGSDRYAMVDDTTCDGSTTYNSASVVGDFDLYNLTNLSSSPTTIDGLRVFGWAQKTDAVGGRAICIPVKSGATQQDGSNFTLASAAWAYHDRGLFLTDPDTAAAWTTAGVNALQVGAKVTV